MTRSPSRRARVLQILSDVSAVPPDEIRDGDLLAGDLGMDSVALMELLGMLDEELGLEVELEAAQEIQDVGTVLRMVDEAFDAG